ncbi:MAG: glutathione S-transferase family protein [Rubrivivax sp.]|jgi:glutathione S-transferase
MARYTLYTARGTCALATHIALLEAGADFALHLLDFKSTEQRSAAYLALNPKGRVPALATPQGVLTETPALLLYVAQTHPHAGLAPLDDPFHLARMQELHSYLASTVHVAHAHKHRGARWADDTAAHDSMRAKVAQNMTDCAVLLEDWLEPGPWVLGDRYSVADAYLYVVAGWMDSDGVDMQRFARLRAHQARVAARPATQQALAQLG